MRAWGEQAGWPLARGRNLFTARGAARLLCAAATLALACQPALAQQVADELPALDPSAPLDAMPDLGVDWP
ncbi:MAG: hypothetical protein H0X53_07745, partial [Sphingomonas sp.]|nr:hypothetical protein [Sphingomonas sp.]